MDMSSKQRRQKSPWRGSVRQCEQVSRQSDVYVCLSSVAGRIGTPNMREPSVKASIVGVMFGAAIAIMACTGRGSFNSSAIHAVPKAEHCANGDQPETGLQGQVPAALRAPGFDGFNCNLKLLGQYRGEGGGSSAATFRDRAGRRCAFYATGYIKNILTGQPIARKQPGVAVVDITDPMHPVYTTSLTTKAMMDPWESLRVNPRRGVLGADFGANAGLGGPEIDLYDLTEDCRSPKLLFSGAVGTGTNGGIRASKSILGHEGAFAPDGLTYYIGDLVNATVNAIDVSDLSKPKLISQFDMTKAPLAVRARARSVRGVKNIPNITIGTAHGLSISDDGNRGYFVSLGYASTDDVLDAKFQSSDGFYVVDTSDVQSRKPGAQMKLISTVSAIGTMAQHTLPVRIAGKPYLVFVEEGGAVTSTDSAPPSEYVADIRGACRAGYQPFPMPRIYDISDERHPRVLSNLALETHDPANCSKVIPDLTGLYVFSYGSHYCTADNRRNATALACAYLNSGIRVFDIRDPSRPREIAYFNPAGARSEQAGSVHNMFKQWRAGAPDWCKTTISFDFASKTLTTMCSDNGLLIMQFESGMWPMKESTPSTEQTN